MIGTGKGKGLGDEGGSPRPVTPSWFDLSKVCGVYQYPPLARPVVVSASAKAIEGGSEYDDSSFRDDDLFQRK